MDALEQLEQLKRSGNSIFVVGHDLEMMRRADWLVDVGPGAGEHGGRVMYSGPPAGLCGVVDSQTAALPFRLFGTAPPTRRAPRAPGGWIERRDVLVDNLGGVNATFPLGLLTAVTGASGLGKSSLVTRALVDISRAHFGISGHRAPQIPMSRPQRKRSIPCRARPERCAGICAASSIKRLVQVSQKPTGRTPRSNLATYTGLFDPVRKPFAASPAATQRKFDAGRFLFNLPKGRCETCEGERLSRSSSCSCRTYAPCPT